MGIIPYKVGNEFCGHLCFLVVFGIAKNSLGKTFDQKAIVESFFSVRKYPITVNCLLINLVALRKATVQRDLGGVKSGFNR
jgi:hypothetical protein